MNDIHSKAAPRRLPLASAPRTANWNSGDEHPGEQHRVLQAVDRLDRPVRPRPPPKTTVARAAGVLQHQQQQVHPGRVQEIGTGAGHRQRSHWYCGTTRPTMRTCWRPGEDYQADHQHPLQDDPDRGGGRQVATGDPPYGRNGPLKVPKSKTVQPFAFPGLDARSLQGNALGENVELEGQACQSAVMAQMNRTLAHSVGTKAFRKSA
jgi:hypothetical protein